MIQISPLLPHLEPRIFLDKFIILWRVRHQNDLRTHCGMIFGICKQICCIWIARKDGSWSLCLFLIHRTYIKFECVRVITMNYEWLMIGLIEGGIGRWKGDVSFRFDIFVVRFVVYALRKSGDRCKFSDGSLFNIPYKLVNYLE